MMFHTALGFFKGKVIKYNGDKKENIPPGLPIKYQTLRLKHNSLSRLLTFKKVNKIISKGKVNKIINLYF